MMTVISDANLVDLAQRSRSQELEEGVKGQLYRFFEMTLNLSGDSWRAES